MGRLLSRIKRRVEQAQEIHKTLFGEDDFEKDKPKALQADIRMISGCEDSQTSADVSDVRTFKLPDPQGRAGGACTSTLLNILYKDHETPSDEYTFVEVLNMMRKSLQKGGYTQIPQLTSANKLDMNAKFDLVPPEATGKRRAVMVGINYIGHNPGELSGCQNDVANMKQYIMNVHGFQEEDITLLLDDGEHTEPTKENMIAAYQKIVSESEPGDAVFLHYSGHGTKMKDTTSDEEDGYDEALCPVDYATAGMILDDELFDIIVKGLPQGVHVLSLMDCCHSGTILDLPYVFLADGKQTEMTLDPTIDYKKLFVKLGGKLLELLQEK